MLALLSFVKKEFRQLLRDTWTLRLILVMPIVQLLLMGYAVTMDIKHVPTLMVDQDQSQTSRELIGHFNGGEFFNLKGTLFSLDGVKPALDAGKASLAVIIPEDFERKLKRQETAEIQLLVDGGNANTAQIATGYASRIIQNFSTGLIDPRMMSRIHLIGVENRNAFNPNLQSTYFYIPGILTMLVMINTMILAALSIVGEREKGTLDQLMVTPLTGAQFIIGKLLPFIVSALVVTSLGLTFATLWFHIPIRGNLWTLLFFTIIFLFTSSGLGILLSAISQSKMQAMFMAFFFMMTLMMMSGFFAPVENSPPLIEWISRLNPMRYYITVCREVIIKGTPFHLLLHELWALIASGTVVLSSGIALQRKRSA